MFFGGMMDPFSMFSQGESDSLGNLASGLAEGAVKAILNFFTDKKTSTPQQLSPQGGQILQQIMAETQMSGPLLPEMVVQRAQAFGLPPEEAQLLATSYAFQLIRMFTISLTAQQALMQELLTGMPAEQVASNLAMQKGLQPLEVQMIINMINLSRSRQDLVRQVLHHFLSLDPAMVAPMQVYQQALQMGLFPPEAIFVAQVVKFLA